MLSCNSTVCKVMWDVVLILVQEFLESNCRLPEFDGMLYIKLEGKKVWKKLYFILRASGIYYNPKGKSKVTTVGSYIVINTITEQIRSCITEIYIAPLKVTAQSAPDASMVKRDSF